MLGKKSLLPKGFAAEVVFLMDGSMKVSESDFNFERKFVKSLAKALLQDSVDVRAALITYGNYPVNVMKLGRYANLRDFELRTDLARLVGGPRRVDRAIESVATLLEDARSGVPRIVVLITAGEQGLGASSLSEAVKPLKKHGANLFVVGVGGSADFKPFRKLVTDERFFILPGFDRLIGDTNRIVVALSKQSCKSTNALHFVLLRHDTIPCHSHSSPAMFCQYTALHYMTSYGYNICCNKLWLSFLIFHTLSFSFSLYSST